MTRRQRVALLGAIVALPVLTAQAQPNATGRSPLEGAWDYLPPLRGQALYVGNHYVMFNTRPDSAPTATTLTESDQAKLYRTLGLQSGTFAIADTVVTMSQAFAKNPRQAARTWRWSYAIKGDTLTWHVLDAQGKATASGRSVRAP
jgi:hypothetical protein